MVMKRHWPLRINLPNLIATLCASLLEPASPRLMITKKKRPRPNEFLLCKHDCKRKPHLSHHLQLLTNDNARSFFKLSCHDHKVAFKRYQPTIRNTSRVLTKEE